MAEFKKVVCPHCGRELVGLHHNINTAIILCPKCKKWVEIGEMPEIEDVFYWQIINKRIEKRGKTHG